MSIAERTVTMIRRFVIFFVIERAYKQTSEVAMNSPLNEF